MCVAVGFVLGGSCLAQDGKAGGNTNEPSQGTNATADKPKFDQEEAEMKFKALLTKATLAGYATSLKDGKLGEEKGDKYNVVNVVKTGGDALVVSARLKYGDREFVAPIPVQVKWAGDTPVMIVDNVGIPGGSTYSARVMFYNQTYSGTWTGARGGGGMIYGVITNDVELNRQEGSTNQPAATAPASKPGS